MSGQLLHLVCKSAMVGAFAASVLVGTVNLHAANGTWTSSVDGTWSNGSNWASGTVADGANFTANFNTVDITDQEPTTTFPAVGIELDTPRTVGHLIFGDANPSSPGAWDLFTGNQATNILTLADATKPTITVNPLGPVGSTAQDAARVLVDLAGTQGFTKLGNGVLTLQGATSTINGGINVDAGTLRLRSTVPGQAITLANGTTLDTSVSLDAGTAHPINVASGATVNILAATSVELGNFNASGATLNVRYTGSATGSPPTGGTVTADDNWAVNGSPARVNVSSDVADTFFRMRPNGGGFNTTASFQNSHLHLDNITAWSRSSGGPGGNTYNIGALSGTSTAVLSGGGQGGGFVAYYVVGTLNTDTEFAGTIDVSSAPYQPSNTPPPRLNGGLNLTKVGTGTLTLSGTLAYEPTASLNVTRQGGVTTISAGTLKMTNSAAIPGGYINNDPVPNPDNGNAQAFVGTILATVNVQANGTLDVSGYTAGTYSTAPFQQVIGTGNVVGNYAHDEGFIRPGNTLGGTAQNPNPVSTAVAGTLTFADDFTWNGGTYSYDVSLDPNSGNDLIAVGGTATLTSGTVTPNFFAGVPLTGTYTLMTAGSFAGSANNITVNWPGRDSNPVPFVEGNSLKVTVPAVSSASLTWVGNNGPNWDVETTANWTGASPNTFFQADNVTFNDTASSFTVNVVGNVQPSLFNVNNSANDYTISGTGVIGGTAIFSKTGTGMLTMTTNNTFNGAASITGGIVSVENAGGALGTGPLTLANAQLHSNNSAAGGFTNSSLIVPAGANSTIRANKSVAGNATWGIPTLAGDGSLTITSETVGHIIDFSSAANTFTGVLNLVGATDNDGVDPLQTVNTTVFRLNSASSSLPNAEVNLTNGASLRDRATSVQTLTLGALSGDETATLYGYQGGSGATARTWVIGGLNLDTTFAGVIQDSCGSGTPCSTAPVSLTKVGTGELELTGVNIYTGDTRVDGGTLSITNPYLADAADVFVGSGAIFDLNFVGTDTIDSLYLGNAPQNPGTYGSLTSSATFKSPLFTGTGILQVSTLGAPIVTPGDFDGDGDVDGRDFLAWQRNPSVGNLADWQTNYGTGGLTASVGAVPEPTGIVLMFACGFAALTVRKRD